MEQIIENFIEEIKIFFEDDNKRIKHALKVLEYAEQIYTEEGGDGLVIKAAAVLHDIGIKAAEQKYGSSAGRYQELEGPPIAREILKKYCLNDETIDHICKIIANHHSGKNIDTIEFRIIWDADWLVNIPTEFGTTDKVKLKTLIEKTFKTSTGKEMAKTLFLKSDN